MKTEEIKESILDIITEFDEYGYKPSIPVPDPEQMAIKWREKLYQKIKEMERYYEQQIRNRP